MGIFRGKSVIVTGGASGIGRAVCKALGYRGAHITVADINLDGADKTAKDIRRNGGKAEAAALDVTDYAAVKNLVDGTAHAHGSLDYLFNNAGIGIIGEVLDFSLEDWKRILAINMHGVVYGVQAAYPLMVAQGSGHIVNTASLAGITPNPMLTAYTATKHAVVGLTTSLRAEAAGKGVKVSAVCPGLIRTAIMDDSKFIKYDRQKSLDLMPLQGMDPDACARVIVRGVERNKPLIVVTPEAHIAWRVYRAFPWMADAIHRFGLKRIAAIKEEGA